MAHVQNHEQEEHWFLITKPILFYRKEFFKIIQNRNTAAQCICNEGFKGKDCKEKGGGSSGHQSQTRSQQNQGRQSRGHQSGARQNQAHQSQSHQNRGHQSQSHQSQGHQSRGNQSGGNQSGGHQSRGQQRQNFKQTASSCRELNWCNGNGNCGNLRTGGTLV